MYAQDFFLFSVDPLFFYLFNTSFPSVLLWDLLLTFTSSSSSRATSVRTCNHNSPLTWPIVPCYTVPLLGNFNENPITSVERLYDTVPILSRILVLDRPMFGETWSFKTYLCGELQVDRTAIYDSKVVNLAPLIKILNYKLNLALHATFPHALP